MHRRLAVFGVVLLSFVFGHTAAAKVLDTREFLSLNAAALEGDYDARIELLNLYKSGFEIRCDGVSGWDPVGTGFADCSDALDQILTAHNQSKSPDGMVPSIMMNIDNGLRSLGVEDEDSGSGWTPGGTGIMELFFIQLLDDHVLLKSEVSKDSLGNAVVPPLLR